MSRFILRSLLISLALTVASTTFVVPSAVGAPDASELAAEAKVLKLVNKFRDGRGLPALVLHNFIRKQARKHSAYMANQDVLSHDGFDERKQAIADNDSGIKETQICENTGNAEGYANPGPVAKGVVSGWKTVAALRGCMLNKNFAKHSVGVGVVRVGDDWWVTFIAARDTT